MEKPTILIVDDIKDNIDVLQEILKGEYKLKAATSGPTALKIASRFKPDLILLDVMMPEMDGYTVCQRLKDHPETRQIPVIFVTAKDDDVDEAHGFQVGAVDYITKPVNPLIVSARVKTHLALSDQRRALYMDVMEKTQEVQQTRLEIIRVLGRASEFKDNETGLHVVRMSEYCYEIALALGLDPSTALLLKNAAPMHDVGKIGIPDHILRKPGKLDEEEWLVMQAHTTIGTQILGEQESELLKVASILAAEHHERIDGKGYPRQLTGDQINLLSKIVTVSDVFDALTSERPYKEAWPVEKALRVMEEGRESQFDGRVLDAFHRALDRILEIKETYRE